MARLRAAAPETRSDVAHLLRRSGFGATPERVHELAALGYEAAVDAVCDLGSADPAADAVPEPTIDTAGYLAGLQGDEAARQAAFRQARDERLALIAWWVGRMVAAERPLREKLTFLWHDHFATSLAKVRLPALMLQQWRALHDGGPGRFDELVRAVAVDPAMLIWLDGRESTAAAPNENFGRELMELFTLGHAAGPDGSQPYTEHDVQEGARALTGWIIDRRTGTGAFVSSRHDAGTKELLGTRGRLGLDDVVDIVTRHPACAPHVVSRLWSRLAYPAGPTDPTVVELATPFADDLDVTALLRRTFLHDAFRSPKARTDLVRMPIDYVVGSLRALDAELDAEPVLFTLRSLAQVPFAPPDVSGWPANEAWLSTSSAQARLAFADALAAVTDVDRIDAPTPDDRPTALARLLSLDGWTDGTATALRAAPDLRRALVVALTSPEHLVA